MQSFLHLASLDCFGEHLVPHFLSLEHFIYEKLLPLLFDLVVFQVDFFNLVGSFTFLLQTLVLLISSLLQLLIEYFFNISLLI